MSSPATFHDSYMCTSCVAHGTVDPCRLSQQSLKMEANGSALGYLLDNGNCSQCNHHFAKHCHESGLARNESYLSRISELEHRVSSMQLFQTPSVLTLASFRDKVLNNCAEWHGFQSPWWDVQRFQVKQLLSSTKLKSFCDEEAIQLIPDDRESSLQQFLLNEYTTKVQAKKAKLKSTKELIQSLHVVDSSQSHIGSSSRKPDFCLVEPGQCVASLYNLAAIISLKKVMNESALTELAAMLEDSLVNNPNRTFIDGCVTDCVDWQFVIVSKMPFHNKCSYRKSPVYRLTTGLMDSNRQYILSFFYQQIFLHGLSPQVSKTFPSFPSPSPYSCRLVASGGSSQVFECHIFGRQSAKQYSPIILKQLLLNDDAIELYNNEVAMLHQLNQSPFIRAYIPQLLSHRSLPCIEILMKPVGIVVHHQDLTHRLISALIDYAVQLRCHGLADWDLRDKNIMMQPNGVGLLKVDLASVFPVNVSRPYHGTLRSAHPDILQAVKQHKPIAPLLAHSLHSLSATCLFWRYLPDMHKRRIAAAGHDVDQLLTCWQLVRDTDQFVNQVFQLSHQENSKELEKCLHQIIPHPNRNE